MQFFNGLFLTLTAAMLVLAQPIPVVAQEVSTKYFSITLPEGWSMPRPVAEMDGTVFVLFINQQDGSAVTITVTPGTLSAGEVAAQTVAALKTQQGVESSAPVEKDGLYMTSFTKSGIKGESWYGSNGREFAVTTIMSDTGRTLLRELKPVDAALFPRF